MIRYTLWLCGRIGVVAFALLTWAYCVSTYSPFAFDMFVRPQLLPWLETFVDWYHAWFAAALAVCSLTLLPDLLGAKARANPSAQWTAAAFVTTGCVILLVLITTPYLRLLSTTSRGSATGFVALVPLLWLGMIDLLATRPMLRARLTAPPTPHHRLLAAMSIASFTVWGTHFARAIVEQPGLMAATSWMTAALWSLAFVACAFSALFVVSCLVVSLAKMTKAPMAFELGASTALLAIGVAEFFRRTVFPSLAFAAFDGTVIAAGLGVTIAVSWAGIRARRAVAASPAPPDVSLLLSPAIQRRGVAAVLIALVPLAAFAITDRIETFDWGFILQKSVTLVEGLLIFGLALRVVRAADRGPATRWILGVPAMSVALMVAIPSMTASADVIRDRYASVDTAFRLTSDAFIARAVRDDGYAVELRAAAERSLEPLPRMTLPPIAEPLTGPPPRRPHVFLFVIDGLRRDYLSPYNANVSFTPAIGDWAREAFVFDNAFTKYGGTWLAMPSIWSGAPVRRGWSRSGFERINALEQLITDSGYRFAINDFTVETHLRPDTKRVFIDPGIKSVDTDICSNVRGIQAELEASADPLFAFMAPMNVYVLNSARSPLVNGFRTGYRDNVARVDRCFGEFVAFLKQTGRFDNSVIAITSDHGESLGEAGNYGHQFFLFPEDIRIPLMLSVPANLRRELTADLSLVSFSTDLVPTLHYLLGREVRDRGEEFGASLLTRPDGDLPQRRRQSQLLASSYGASYGLLRRNGRFLYISDLISYSEYAFELHSHPLGTPVRVTDDLRTVNQAGIRRHIAAVESIYTPQ